MKLHELPEPIRDRIAKIKALADNPGTAGEYAAAQAALNKILGKYHLTVADLEGSTKRWRRFHCYTKTERSLLFQVYSKVLQVNHVTNKKQGRKVWLELTDQQYIDIDAMYAYYRHLFNEELATLFDAFLMKHKLYGTGTTNIDQMTPEEYERWQRSIALAKGLQQGQFHKQIGG